MRPDRTKFDITNSIVLSNLEWLVYGIPVYILFGLVWATVKWFFKIHDVRDRFREIKTEFMVKNKIAANSLFPMTPELRVVAGPDRHALEVVGALDQVRVDGDRQAELLLPRIRRGDRAVAAASAHTLKGSAVGIGAFGVARAAEAVEQAKDAAFAEAIETLVPDGALIRTAATSSKLPFAVISPIASPSVAAVGSDSPAAGAAATSHRRPATPRGPSRCRHRAARAGWGPREPRG